METIKRILGQHHAEYVIQDGCLYALGVYGDGMVGDWTRLDSVSACYNWLGY